MQLRAFVLLVLVGAACVFGDSYDTYHNNHQHKGKQFDTVVLGKNGHAKYLASDLHLGAVSGDVSSDAVLSAYVHASLGEFLELEGTEVFVTKRTEFDPQANRHIVMQQRNRELEVDGGEIIIHMDNNGVVFAVTSSVLSDNIDSTPALTVSPYTAIKRSLRSVLPAYFQITTQPELCYLLFEDQGYLVYRAMVSYTDAEDGITKKDWVYISALDGTLIFRNPLFLPALNRGVYTAAQRTTLPGTLVRSEGGAQSSDPSINQAYDNSGICYQFYYKTFGRDSIDGRGKKLISTVHYSRNYNNAFWDGTQMVYGDGDGQMFSDFAGDLSVVCHELTHAVTSYTANLRYQGESGALNEAMSDIMGASSTMFQAGGGVRKDTWHIGHDCFLAGTALRYMNNPILDGSSYDWYPTRYTGTQDNGGVHWNSGIANLAFVLMVQGGTHPQQKSNTWVEDIGTDEALQVFYSALTQYMTTSTSFAGARAATETAAQRLYGPTTTASVAAAWKAVGVGN